MPLPFVTLTLQAPPKLDGTYEVRMSEPGSKAVKAQDSRTPPGAVRRFVIQGKRWMLFDMMSAWSGPFVAKGRTVTLTTTDSPSGKVKKPKTMVFDLSKDGKTLTMRPAKGVPIRMVFIRISSKPIVKPI